MRTDKRNTKAECIKIKCLECSNGNKKEVLNCKIKNCPLHRYRTGEKTVEQYAEKLTKQQAIRKYCLECYMDNIKAVKNCIFKDCALWRYRKGKESEN